jgi:hypothetical protein
MARLNLGSVELGDFDRDWFIVMSRLGGKSTRANASSVIGFYVRRRIDQYREMLTYTARKYGITEDEVFHRLLNDQELGTPVQGFSEPPPELAEDTGEE